MTIKEWLEGIAKKDSSTEEDSRMMQNLLRRSGAYPNARVVIGVVYLEGEGYPVSIHGVAKMILKDLEGGTGVADTGRDEDKVKSAAKKPVKKRAIRKSTPKGFGGIR